MASGGSDYEKPAVRCVVCDHLQPADGKILKCLHVACRKCLEETLASSGAWQCMKCKTSTRPASGVRLLDVLVDSAKYLYAGDGAAARAAVVAEENVCDYCDEVVSFGCRDCAELLLCTGHATRHRKKRPNHVIVELSAAQSGEKKQREVSCPVHSNRCLSHFCTACETSVCERCVITGHKDHTTESLADTAGKKRQQLASSTQLSRSGRSESAGNGALQAEMQDMAEGIEGEVRKIDEEAVEASEAVTRVFGDIEEMVAAEKAKALKKIDVFRWQKHIEWGEKSDDVEMLKWKYDVAMSLAASLSASESCDADVVRLGGDVIAQMGELRGDIEKQRQLPHRAKLRTSTNAIAVAEVGEKLKQLVGVTADEIDISKSSIIVADRVDAGQEVIIQLAVVDKHGRKIPSTDVVSTGRASVTHVPTASRTTLALTANSESSSEGLAGVWYCFAEEGEYELEVSFGSNAILQKRVVVASSACVLDVTNRTSNITVSDGGRKATHTGTDRADGHVVGAVGYRHGNHQWKFNVSGLLFGRAFMMVGVTMLPLDHGDDYDEGWSPGTMYGWCANAGGYGLAADQTSRHAKMSKWKNNDTLVLTLDCDHKSMELYLERTGERKTITDIDSKGKELYLYVHMDGPGNTIEFL